MLILIICQSASA